MQQFQLGLKDKLTLLIAIVVFVCVAFFSLNFYERTKKLLVESIRTDLKDMAMSLSMSIDPEQVKLVLVRGENSKAYWELKRRLYEFTLLGNKRIHEAYIMVASKKNDVWQFVADSELVDKKNMAGFQEEYDISKFPEMKMAFVGPTADKEVTKDKWGRWLSGYAPINDKNGMPVAILGLDMKASDIDRLKSEILDSVLLYLLIGAVASLIFGRLG
ncbi:MAG: hypothetical protein PHH60_05310, partial [Candidatus Margulisbacteria bacterium]|nr:hypothetical protein [Candidatus Margulisiibacteriota bacterium]